MSSKIIVPLQNYKETIGYRNFSRFFMIKMIFLSLSVTERCFSESMWRAQAVVIPILIVYPSFGMFVPSLNEKNGDIKFGISEHVFLVFFLFLKKGPWEPLTSKNCCFTWIPHTHLLDCLVFAMSFCIFHPFRLCVR